jgi:hypothetical protein
MSRKKQKIETINEIYETTNNTISKKKDLTMLLIYLASREEDLQKESRCIAILAWQGFEFDIMSRLEKDRLIRLYCNSITITNKGVKRGKELDQIYQRRETAEPGMN